MRRSSLAGRVALVVVSTVDSFISVKIYGQASGGELYLRPASCSPHFLFRHGEQGLSFGLMAAIFAGILGAHDHYGAAYLAWSAEDYATLVRINAVSVAMLTAFIAISLGRARGDARSLSDRD